jgi:hypothetical protein
MKRILFLATHIGSGSENLVETLEQSPRIEFFPSSSIFAHPEDLNPLFANSHKNTTANAICGTQLFLNESISGKSFYHSCWFVYFIRRARPAITEIIKRKSYNPKTAIDYYIFRIRRLYEMSVQSKSPVLTWDDIQMSRGLDAVQEYLKLKLPIPARPELFVEQIDLLPQSQVEKAEEVYESILYRINRR